MKESLVKSFFVSKKIVGATTLVAAFLLPNLGVANKAFANNFTLQNVVQEGVQGTVSSVNGPLSGVTVSVKGKSIRTITDSRGVYTIQASKGETLEFSMVGYESRSKLISNAVENIDLSAVSDEIEEVVIVGYGIQQKKESLTGSLQSVSGAKLRDVTTPSVENMLNGKAAGVYVAPSSGKPGGKGSVVIRGQASLSGTTNPLWVIDGVIIGSGPGELNPDDIETLTVLKDAASTSIYGSQGANGVIVVTTKRPSAKQMSLNFSSRIGFNKLTNGNLEVMNGAELYDYYSSFTNANEIKFPRWNENLRNSDFDWWKLATKTGFIQNHNISLQGGTEKLQSFMSLGYYDEIGAVKGYDYDRYNFRLSTVYKPFDWLSVKPSIFGSRRGVEDKQYSTTAMYSNLPWDSPFDENGNLVPHRSSNWVNNQNTNYLYDLQWNSGENTNYEFNGSLDFDIRFTDWLTFSSVNSYRYNTYSASGYTDPRSNGGLNVNGRITDYRQEQARRYTNQILRFKKNWGKHAVNGIVAYEFNDYWTKTLDVYGTGFIPGLEVLDVVAVPERTKGGISEWATQSVLSNAEYAYDEKYLAQVSYRYDEASNFGQKSGSFYSVSGGWNIFKENWFNVDWVNNLKLRASYGTVGNRPAALYPQYSVYSVSTGASYNGLPGALISTIGNKGLTWEETAVTDFGVDAAFFNSRLRFNFDYYNKNTKNILYNVPISGLTGVTSVYKNIGKMNNKGVELVLGGDIIRNSDWLWSVDVNMGHNVNKLVSLIESRNPDGTFSSKPLIVGDPLGIAGSANRVLELGLPVDTYYAPEWAGVNVETGAPMWYKVTRDANGNETARETTSNYAEASQEKLGKASADLFGGITTNLRYKQFELSALFGYSIGGQIYNYARQEYDSDGTYTDRNQMKLQDGWSRWEKPGDIATHPRAKYNNTDRGNATSSRYLESGDFLRMRSLTLGYNFDLKKYHVKNLRVFFSGDNLFTWTKYSGVDPEVSVDDNGTIMNSTGPGVYPAVRKYVFGVNVSF
jgi:TonB-linked SusC/RagA family outer membrane protein